MRNLVRSAVLTILSILIVQSPAVADEAFQWDRWRNLAVLDGGRAKPFESLAREAFRAISNRVDIADPEGGQQLDAVTWYLVMLLDWQGWSDAATTKDHGSSGENAGYFAAHQPDKWDQAPLLRIDNLELRSALGWDLDRRFVSPLDVYHANLPVPAAGKESSLLRWTQDLAKKVP